MSIFDHLVKNNLIPPEQSRITPKRFRIYRIPDSTLHPYMVKINYEAIHASIIHILYPNKVTVPVTHDRSICNSMAFAIYLDQSQ